MSTASLTAPASTTAKPPVSLHRETAHAQQSGKVATTATARVCRRGLKQHECSWLNGSECQLLSSMILATRIIHIPAPINVQEFLSKKFFTLKKSANQFKYFCKVYETIACSCARTKKDGHERFRFPPDSYPNKPMHL